MSENGAFVYRRDRIGQWGQAKTAADKIVHDMRPYQKQVVLGQSQEVLL